MNRDHRDQPTVDSLEDRLRGALTAMADDVRADDVRADADLGSDLGSDLGNTDRDAGRFGEPTARAGWVWPGVAAAAVLAVLGLATVVPGGLGDRSEPAPPAASGSSNPTPAAASAVDETAAKLTAFAEEPGYAKVSVDYDAGQVDVLWDGQPPAGVQDLEGVQANGVRVVVGSAEYSEADLEQAGTRLLRAPSESRDGAEVVTVAANRDRSGLIVEVLAPWDGSTRVLADVAGVPVQVKLVTEGPQDLPGTVN